MKIVMSWWTRPTPRVTCDQLELYALSSHLAAQHYEQVDLVTDRLGKDFLVDRMRLPFTSVSTSLESLNDVDPRFWVAGKLQAYAQQEAPFIHIDADVLLWQPLPPVAESAAVLVQNDEFLDQYRGWLQKFSRQELISRVLPLRRFVAHNLGVFGGTDTGFIRRYATRALRWVRSLGGRFDVVPNMVLEQATVAKDAADAGVQVTRLFDELRGSGCDTSTVETPGYTHLTATKAWPAVQRRVRYELARRALRRHIRVYGPVVPHPMPRDVEAPVVFHHSGDLGDIVFGLSAMGACGGGELVLSPEIRLCRPTATREVMSEKRVDFMRRFLCGQPAVRGVRFSKHMPDGPDVCDLNQWREGVYHADPAEAPLRNLEWLHREAAHCLPADGRVPWLVAPSALAGGGLAGRIVVGRTPRYHNWLFPWAALVARYRKKMVFIGLDDEYQEFCRQFGKVARHAVRDAQDIFEAVASAASVVANQSLVCAMAEGLKKPLVQESCPDCPTSVYFRERAIYTAEGLVPLERITTLLDSVVH